MKQHKEWIAFVKEQFPPGTRLRVREMKDSYSPVPPGTEGTVSFVDDACTVHCKWDNGQMLGLIPGEDRFSVIAPKLFQLKLYMPLTASLYEYDDYGHLQDEPVELNGRELLAHEGAILSLIKRQEVPEEAERGLMCWYHKQDAMNDKVMSLRATVEMVDGKFMGVAVCMVKGTLSSKELGTLKEYITGQMSDGWGEGFEQREIKVEDGELYVSFWSGHDSWYLKTEEEFFQSQQQSEAPHMGGLDLG